MIKTAAIVLSIAAAVLTAEVSSSYSLLGKHAAFNPDLKTEQINSHPILKKEANPEDMHPVYDGEGRARIELVQSEDPVVRHDMLNDQAAGPQRSDVNRIDSLTIPNYGYVPQQEVAYPDVAYAPGYGYDGYAAPNTYDAYGNSLSPYEEQNSALSLLWSQMPDSRAIVGFFGRTLAWTFNSMFVLLFGSLITVAICSYSELCSIHFHGIGPIHEEMRSLMTPERLEKIGHAADFVKNAIDKYQKIQQKPDTKRSQKSLF